ncbi:MAG: transporter substrate-binding domain-containing protein [Oscillibacter sp.]|nr:transporter substrate-binding domain-containing protein [Oscillibacter sp.]
MRKSFFRAALSLFGVLVLTAELVLPCAASEPSSALKVAFCPLDGFFEYDVSGNETGYGVELLNKLTQYTGITFEYVAASSWESTRQMLLSGEADLRMPVSLPTAPSAILSYSNHPVLNTYHVLMTLKSNEELYYCDYDSFHSLKIAVSGRLLASTNIASCLPGLGISEDQLVICSEYNECRAKLNAGEVDAVISNVMDLSDDMKMLARFNNATNHISMRLNDPSLALLDDALGQLELDEPLFLSDLYKKWFPERVSVPLTKTESDYVASVGTLRFAFADDEGYLSRLEDGEYKGYFPALAKRLCEKLGVEYEAVSRDMLEELDAQGKTVVLSGYSHDLSRAGEDGVSITDAFFTSNYYCLQRKNSSIDLSSCTVAAVPSSEDPDQLIERDFSPNQILYFNNYEECIRAVSSGQADITILNNYIAEYYLSMYQYGNLIPILTDDYNHSVCFGVTRGDDTLSSVLSKTLNTISDDEMEQLIIGAQAARPEASSLLALIHNYPMQSLILLTALAGLLATLASLLVFARRTSRQNLALQSANAAKTDFLSRMSHDMRTPMNGILGMTALTIDLPGLSPEAQANLSAIRDSSNYLLSLINDTLDMSRIESQKIELHKEPVRAAELITQTLAGISQSAQKKGIKIVAKFMGFRNDYINVDRVRVRQIFTNLLSNAVKFTPGFGKIECLVECLSREEGRCLVRITIRDSGVGMSEEFLQHAFEPFAQEPNSQSNKYAGTGLGLPIVQNLVHLMGGTISICSKLNEGTAVAVELPFELLEGYQPPVSDDAAAFFDLQGRRVLLCEDHPLNATIAVKLLSKVGVEVEHAEDGRQGVDLFIQRNAGYYDAILMDIRMPIMDGLSATRAIRALHKSDAKTIPIIAMTANAFDFDVKASLSAGMDAHLDKPVDPEKLYRTLSEQMGLRGGGKRKSPRK